MKQLELFKEDGLKPIQRWLTCWTEAEREARLKVAEEVMQPAPCSSCARKPNQHQDEEPRNECGPLIHGQC